MKIHCPLCSSVFDREVGSSDDLVKCPSCGRDFRLSSKETIVVDQQAPASPPLPGQRLGGYLIKREIGRGGMGIVYEGLQESLGRRVAVKTMYSKHSRDPQFVARFNREAKSLANLSHPNIVGILDRGEENGIYYFVMEYVDGVSLRELITQGKIPSAQALSIVPKICDALEYAHSQGVIHRDIKPENILIDKLGNVKIADFGLSRIISGENEDPRITGSNLVMGTVDYMAPEQRLASKSVDHRADIYSLGVVFYELLTGELPIGRFDPPSKKNLEIDIRIDEVVLKILDKNPEMRYQRASDVGSDITSITHARAAAPPPPVAALPQDKPLMEKIEDRWESWVLAGVVVLFFLHPSTNWVLFVAWGILYKSIKDKRRLAAGSPGPAAFPRPSPAPARAPAAVKFHPSGPEQTFAPINPPPAPAAAHRASEAAAMPVDRSVSVLAVLVFAYSLIILLAFPIGLPFKDELLSQFVSLPTEVMAGVLSALALGVIPGFAGLILAIIARGRITPASALSGRFMATLAVLANLVFIGNFGSQWYGAYKEYRTWKSLGESAARSEPGAIEELRRLAAGHRAEKAMQIVSGLEPGKAFEFCSWALSGEAPEAERAAARTMVDLAGRGLAAESEKALAALASDPRRSARLRAEIASAASALPPASAVAVIGAACQASAEPDVKRSCAKALGAVRDDRAETMLAALSADKERAVAREAVRALRNRRPLPGGDRRAEILGSILSVSPDRDIREEALDGIEEVIESTDPVPRQLVDRLQEASQSDSDDEIRRKAGRALEKAARKNGNARTGMQKSALKQD